MSREAAAPLGPSSHSGLLLEWCPRALPLIPPVAIPVAQFSPSWLTSANSVTPAGPQPACSPRHPAPRRRGLAAGLTRARLGGGEAATVARE